MTSLFGSFSVADRGLLTFFYSNVAFYIVLVKTISDINAQFSKKHIL